MNPERKKNLTYDMRREKDMFHWVAADTLMSAEETLEHAKKHGNNKYMAILEPRDTPVHNPLYFPMRWKTAASPKSLVANAQPGEFFTFQVAVYAYEEIGAVSLEWDGNIPGPECFNLGGVDYKGNDFTKTVVPAVNRVQPLWLGFDISKENVSQVKGTLTVKPDGAEPTTLTVNISVSGEVLLDGGDSEPWKHSRLRWLNSRVAQDRGVTLPFAPLKVIDGSEIKTFAHSIKFGENGLPQQITSAFTPTVENISLDPRQILSAPITLEAEGVAFTQAEPAKIVFECLGEVHWQSKWNAPGFSVKLNGKMEYDGYMEYSLDFEADKDVTIPNVCMSIPYHACAAKYWMGLGKQGGYRDSELNWKWDQTLNQDTLWMGDVNAGLMVRLKDDNYRKPYMLIYYHYHPLVMPKGWDNNGNGSVTVRENGGSVVFEAQSGQLKIAKGDKVNFSFDLSVTPVKPIDKREHWLDRYYHMVPSSMEHVASVGANVVNIHHGNEYNPYINYPFFENAKVAKMVEDAHANSIKLKLYHTVKEITVRMPEFWAFKSLGSEVIPSTWEIGTSFQGSVPYADEYFAKHLVDGYITAWRQKVNSGEYVDETEASVVCPSESRWNNFWLQSVEWLMENLGIDGLYFDDVAFNRSVMKRVRKILDRHHPGCRIDLHTWNYYSDNNVDDTRPAGYGNSMNLYIDNVAFLDRLWIGEGFDYDIAPDKWLVELSGIPFGMMGEMLQNGGNVWRGMVFGMTNRYGWQTSVTHMWKVWDEFKIHNATMLGAWNKDCPVKTGRDDILCTVYKQAHRSMISIASWAKEDVEVKFDIDWQALGLDPDNVTVRIPEIPDFQDAARFDLSKPVPVPAGKGWIIFAE